jgi:hypothetical protein
VILFGNRSEAKTMSRRAVLKAILTSALLGVLIPGAALSQDRPPPPLPAAPGSAGPTWQRTLRLSDGRTFVSDGGLAIDAALAKPATLPADVLPSASVLERQLSAQMPDEFGLSQLSPRPDGRTYRTPSGVDLNQTYIDFLRRVLPPAQVRLRMGGGREPVIVVLGGKPVGVFMPVAR